MTDIAVAVQLVRESQNPHEFSEACQVVAQLFQRGNNCAALMSADSLNEAVELRVKLGLAVLVALSTPGKKKVSMGQHERDAVECAVAVLRLGASCGRFVAQGIWTACHATVLVPCLLPSPSSSSSAPLAVQASGSFQQAAYKASCLCPSLRRAAVELIGAASTVGDSLIRDTPLHAEYIDQLDVEMFATLTRVLMDDDHEVCAAALEQFHLCIPMQRAVPLLLSLLPAVTNSPALRSGGAAVALVVARWERLPLPLMFGPSAAAVSKMIRALAGLELSDGDCRASAVLAARMLQNISTAASHALSSEAKEHVGSAVLHVAAAFWETCPALRLAAVNSLTSIWRLPRWSSPIFRQGVARIAAHPSPAAARQALASLLCQQSGPAPGPQEVDPTLVAEVLVRYLVLCENASALRTDGQQVDGGEILEVSNRAAGLVFQQQLGAEVGSGQVHQILLQRVRAAADPLESNGAYWSAAAAATWIACAAAFAKASCSASLFDISLLFLEAAMAGALRSDDEDSVTWSRNVVARCPRECCEVLDSVVATLLRAPFAATTSRTFSALMRKRHRVRLVALAMRACGIEPSSSSNAEDDVAAVSLQQDADQLAQLVEHGLGKEAKGAKAMLRHCAAEVARWKSIVRGAALPDRVLQAEKRLVIISDLNDVAVTKALTLRISDSESSAADQCSFEFAERWCSIRRQQRAWKAALGETIVEDAFFVKIDRSVLPSNSGSCVVHAEVHVVTPDRVVVPVLSAVELLGLADEEGETVESFGRLVGRRVDDTGGERLLLKAEQVRCDEDGSVACFVVYRAADGAPSEPRGSLVMTGISLA